VADATDGRPRILVLGAAGFIGNHVARLIAGEREIGEGIFLDRVPPRQSGPEALGKWTWFDVVEESERQLGRFLEDLAPEAIVNCIGATQGTWDQMQLLNVGVVQKLVSVLASSCSAQLVHLGSAAEYGPAEAWAPARESDEARPVSDYAATKLAGTELVREAAESGQISATVLRVFNPLGAGAPPGSLVGRAVTSFHEAQASGCRSVKTGDLESSRDYIDVRDVARAVLLASRRRYRPGQPVVLNVGRGIPVSSRWLVHRLAAIAHFDGEIVEEAQGSSTRSGTVPWQWADTAAVHRELGWTPRYLLSDALDQAWSAPTGTGPANLHIARPPQALRPLSALVAQETTLGAARVALSLPEFRSYP
jgi:NDP-hexose 4-ketoreductase